MPDRRAISQAAVKPAPLLLALLAIAGVATVGLTQTPSPNGPAADQVQAFGVGGVVQPAPAPRVGAAGDMIGFSHTDGSGTQTITLVHAEKSWMAVYHVDRSGKIRLVSSRPLDADFSLQLNATSPLPEEIRAIGRR